MFATLILMTVLGPLPGESMLIARDVTHVKVYYISDTETGPERYIGATIWDPNKVSEIANGKP